jgi:uncharacterized protein
MHTTQPPACLQLHQFRGSRPGPRLLVTGAVHGNETCGTRAIQGTLEAIARGELRVIRGQVTFVPVCNPLAYAKGQRMGERNLNRRLLPTDRPETYEDHVANILCPLLSEHEVLLDLHSFRGQGKPFALCGPADNAGDLEPFTRSAEERLLVQHLGVDRVVEGWMSAYAGGIAQRRQRAARGDTAAASALEDISYGVGTTEYMRSCGGYGVTLECGQHDDPRAPEVGAHAIRQTLALLGLIDRPPTAPTGPMEALRLAFVVDRHDAADTFVQSWSSFDPLRAGELIARRADGSDVRAPGEGYIVFPDVAARPGHEWFYIATRSNRAF